MNWDKYGALFLKAPDGFEQFLLYFIIGAVIAGITIGVFLILQGQDSSNTLESPWSWAKPLGVVLVAMDLWGDLLESANFWQVFGVSFVIGLFCGLTSAPPFLAIRDYIISAVSVILSIVMLVHRFSLGSEVATIYIVYTVALFGGMLISVFVPFWKKSFRPMSGMAFLGGIIVLDFFISPFGLDFIYPSDIDLFRTGVISAVLLGVVLNISPVFVNQLSNVVIQILVLWLPVLIFFAHEYDSNFGYLPDWNGAAAFIGAALGYAILRTPMRMLQRI